MKTPSIPEEVSHLAIRKFQHIPSTFHPPVQSLPMNSGECFQVQRHRARAIWCAVSTDSRLTTGLP